MAIVLAATLAVARAQQAGATRFVYDNNGRLTAVISPNGEAAVYGYDAAGNFTAVRRIGADTLTLLAFAPHEGGGGDEVTFVGTGFNAGVTSVSFNGSSAQIASATPSAVIAIVPDAATTGPVTIVTPRGTLITPVPFTVVSRVRVLPSAATLLAGDTVAFTAVVGGGGDQSVIWAVNGIPGGDTTVGSVSNAGLYTAPNLPGNASLSVVVRATSVAQPALFGESQVKVLNPNAIGAMLAAIVSVRRGDPRGVAATLPPPVSVRRAAVISGPSAAWSHPVSVGFGARVVIVSPFVSTTTGPAISSISPASIARGATVTMAVNGANLDAGSNVRFIDSNGAVDNAITATNLNVNADGTQLTATVTVASGASTGARSVVVTAGAGTTPAAPAGPNTITIQ